MVRPIKTNRTEAVLSIYYYVYSLTCVFVQLHSSHYLQKGAILFNLRISLGT